MLTVVRALIVLALAIGIGPAALSQEDGGGEQYVDWVSPGVNDGRDLAIEITVTPQPRSFRFLIDRDAWRDRVAERGVEGALGYSLPWRKGWGCAVIRSRFVEGLTVGASGVAFGLSSDPSNAVTTKDCLPPAPMAIISLPEPTRGAALVSGLVGLAALAKARRRWPP